MGHFPDVLIVGGGIIGLTAAYALAKAGRTVEVCDAGALGREASWAGAGILPPGNTARAATSLDWLRACGAEQYPHFAQELHDFTGVDPGYRRNGGVEFLAEADRYAVELWAKEGVEHERLASHQLEDLLPGCTVPAGTPYFLPGLAQVRNPRHLRALIAGCERLGVRLRPYTSVEGWTLANGRIRAARLAAGNERPAGQFLVAAGAWSNPLLELLSVRLAVHPVRGQIVLLKSTTEALGPTVLIGKRYLVPRGDGCILIGSTEEPEAGFAKESTSEGVAALLAFAHDLLPALRAATLQQSWAGLRPETASGVPAISAVAGFANAFAAVGHFRAGVQLAPGTAVLLTALMADQPTPVSAAAFALDRSPAATAKPAFRS